MGVCPVANGSCHQGLNPVQSPTLSFGRALSDRCLTHHWRKIVVEAEQFRYGRQRIRQFELQAHSIELSPDRDAVVIGVTEGYVKFRRQMNNIRQQQPNARGREISHRTSDKCILLKQDHACLGALVPRGQSPFNASIHSAPQLRSCCRLATARLSLRGRSNGASRH
jgi:hypothetical protein